MKRVEILQKSEFGHVILDMWLRSLHPRVAHAARVRSDAPWLFKDDQIPKASCSKNSTKMQAKSISPAGPL